MKYKVLLLLLATLHVLYAGGKGDSDDGVVKVLAIGNSFSADAIENNLFDLAKEKGIRMVVANLYIGGAPLTLHVKNAEENKNAYSLRKTGVDGSRTTTAQVSLETALAAEDWDYISFQQASPLSGQLHTIEASLPALYKYVKERAKNQQVKFIYHQTWAYSAHAVHTGFANYDRDQDEMYRAIAGVSEQVNRIAPIDIVVPAGTAIQNARTSYIGDNFDRDGYHLRFSLGRYVAACTWFEKLFGIPVVGMQYKPADVSETEKEVAQAAAHYAVENPFEVTPLTKFRKGPKGVKQPQGAVLVDFGGASHEGVWNPIVSPLPGKEYVLKDSLSNPTRISLEMLEGFSGKSSNGTGAPETPYHFPAAVTKTGYFGEGTTSAGDGARAKFKLKGLSARQTYDISFFASRMGDTIGVQETRIVCEGADTQENTVNITDNVSKLGHFNTIKPARDGTITFTVNTGDRNQHPERQFFLSALRLEVEKD